MIMKLYSGRGEDGYSIHQCSFGGTAQSIVMLDYSEDVAALRGRLDEALKVLGADLEVRDCKHTSYVDVSIQGMWDAGNFASKIPCRSIWSASGKRLAVALILDAS
jgi:diphthine-ammonia ligase